MTMTARIREEERKTMKTSEEESVFSALPVFAGAGYQV